MKKQKNKNFIKQTGQCNLAMFIGLHCTYYYEKTLHDFLYQIFDIRTDLRILDIKKSWILCAVCT